MKNMMRRSIGQRLSYWRQKQGKSRYDLARLTNTATSTIKAYEHGRMEPTAVMIKQLCQALGITERLFFMDY